MNRNNIIILIKDGRELDGTKSDTTSSVLNRITVRPITYKLIIFRALTSRKTLSFMFITEGNGIILFCECTSV